MKYTISYINNSTVLYHTYDSWVWVNLHFHNLSWYMAMPAPTILYIVVILHVVPMHGLPGLCSHPIFYCNLSARLDRAFDPVVVPTTAIAKAVGMKYTISYMNNSILLYHTYESLIWVSLHFHNLWWHMAMRAPTILYIVVILHAVPMHGLPGLCSHHIFYCRLSARSGRAFDPVMVPTTAIAKAVSCVHATVIVRTISYYPVAPQRMLLSLSLVPPENKVFA